LSGTLLALVLTAQFYSGMPQFQRLSFNLPLADAGGTVIGLAGRMEYLRPDYIVASGGVDVRYGSKRIQAQRIEMDLNNNTVLAEGDVILDDGPQRIGGARMEYDLGSETGTVYDARASMGKDLFFYGAEMNKVGPDVYTLVDGVLTSCEKETPAWSFKISRARVVMEGFARIYNTTMRVKRLPFLYTPFIMIPAKSERASGFLTPNLGYSERRGSVVGLAYFQTFGDSYDATFYGDHYDKGIDTFGLEFRYAPVQGTSGIFEGFVVDDKNQIFGDPGTEGSLRWRIRWQQRSTQLPLGLTAVVNITDFSDFNFFRDFSRNFDAITVRNIQSSGFVQGAWGKHSLSFLIENQEQFITTGVSRSRRQLPEIEYGLRSTQVFNLPIYFASGAGFHVIEVTTTGQEKIAYQRFNVTPRVSIPVGTTWLSANFNAAAKAVWYTDSLSEPDEMGKRSFTGEAISQTSTALSANIIGPSFSRVFHKGIGQWGKFKHVIEPRWDYTTSSEVDNAALIPVFDQIDGGGAASELATFRFVNRLLGKPADEDSPFGAREIMSLELSQRYSLKEDQPLQRYTDAVTEETFTLQESPISLQFRYRPSITTNLDIGTEYNTLFNNINRVSVSAGKVFDHWGTNLTYSSLYEPRSGETLGSQLRLGTNFAFFRDRLFLRSSINYDLEQDLLQQQSHSIDFITQCWGMHFDIRQTKSLTREDRDIRFSISLKNIGSFIDLHDTTRDLGF
jgi:LPS-assembly protein